MRRVTAIIQARTGSTRLPGKVLKEVLGQPLLAWQLERAARAARLERLVVATTSAPGDDPVAELAERLGIDVCRGSEQDVLDRYYQCAAARGVEHLMRLTGDCPLIDPAVLDAAVDAYFAAGVDHLATSPRFAEGLDCEVLSFAALEQAWREARKPSEREHVTLYLRNHPERFRLAELDNDRNDSAFRITVDEPKDFEVVRAVIEALHPERPDFGFAEVRAWLLAHPEILDLNRAVVRNEGLLKSLREETAAGEGEA